MSHAHTHRIATALLGVTLAACQPGWVRLDGTGAGDAELQAALAACAVAEKRAQLEATHGDGDEAVDAINENEARMLRLENYDSAKRRVEKEIENCMRARGLRAG